MNAQGGHFQFQLKPNIGGGQAWELEHVSAFSLRVERLMAAHGLAKCWAEMPSPQLMALAHPRVRGSMTQCHRANGIFFACSFGFSVKPGG